MILDARIIPALILTIARAPATVLASGHDVINVPGGQSFPQELIDPAIANDNLSVDLGNTISIPGAQPSIDPGFGLSSGPGAPAPTAPGGIARNAGQGGDAGAEEGGDTQRIVDTAGRVQHVRVVCPPGTQPETRPARNGTGLRWVCAY